MDSQHQKSNTRVALQKFEINPTTPRSCEKHELRAVEHPCPCEKHELCRSTLPSAALPWCFGATLGSSRWSLAAREKRELLLRVALGRIPCAVLVLCGCSLLTFSH